MERVAAIVVGGAACRPPAAVRRGSGRMRTRMWVVVGRGRGRSSGVGSGGGLGGRGRGRRRKGTRWVGGVMGHLWLAMPCTRAMHGCMHGCDMHGIHSFFPFLSLFSIHAMPPKALSLLSQAEARLHLSSSPWTAETKAPSLPCRYVTSSCALAVLGLLT